MEYTFTKITAHNLVSEDSSEERHVVISSGFDGKVLVVKEDAYGFLGVDRMSVKECQEKFGVKLTKENGRRSKTKSRR